MRPTQQVTLESLTSSPESPAWDRLPLEDNRGRRVSRLVSSLHPRRVMSMTPAEHGPESLLHSVAHS